MDALNTFIVFHKQQMCGPLFDYKTRMDLLTDSSLQARSRSMSPSTVSRR